MKVLETFKHVRASLKNNLFKYLVIWSISELIGYLFLKGTTMTLLNLAMKTMGVSGITNENYLQVFQSPFTILLMLLVLVSLGVLAIVQTLATFNLSLDSGKIPNLFKPLKRLKVKDILPLIAYTILVIPFSNVGLTVFFLSNLKIPDFVLAVVYENNVYFILYTLALLIIAYLNIKLFYTFIIFFEEDVSFFDAMKLSFKETKGKFFHIIRYAILVAVVTVFMSLGVAFIYIIFNMIAIKFPDIERISVAFGASLIVVSAFLLMIIASIYSIQYIIISYHKEPLPPTKKLKTNYFKYAIPLSILILTGYGVIVYTPQAQLEDIKIIAHRGVTTDAIENTLESLVAAKELNADYVELDVQELNDGTPIVYHDPNLKRLTGLNKRVGDVSWDEIKDLELYQNNLVSYIPRFDEYLEVAAEIGQPLLVEIKTNPTDSDDFVKNVLDTVNNSSINKDDVIYQSITKNTILKVKELQPETYTGYIIGFNIGGLENFDVDAYSIDETSVTKRVMIDARRYEKDLFIWSVDSTDVIERAFAKKPAGIITDEIGIVEDVKEDLLNQPMSRMLWQLDF